MRRQVQILTRQVTRPERPAERQVCCAATSVHRRLASSSFHLCCRPPGGTRLVMPPPLTVTNHQLTSRRHFAFDHGDFFGEAIYTDAADPTHPLVNIREIPVSIGDHIVAVEMNSPPVNVLTSQLIRELTAAFQQIAQECDSETATLENPKAKSPFRLEPHLPAAPLSFSAPPTAVILKSLTPKAFSAGLDLRVVSRADQLDFDKEFFPYWSSFQDLFLLMNTFPLPIIASINGNCAAAGCILAMACDASIMAREGSPEALRATGHHRPDRDPRYRIGIPSAKGGFRGPDFSAVAMAELMGTRHAELVLQLGIMPTADEAKAMGLVDDVVGHCGEELQERVFEEALRWSRARTPYPRREDEDGTAGAPRGDHATLRRISANSSWTYSVTKEHMRGRWVRKSLGTMEAKRADGKAFYDMLRRPDVASVIAAYTKGLSSSSHAGSSGTAAGSAATSTSGGKKDGSAPQ